MSSGPFRPAHQVLAVFLASLCFLSEIKCMYVKFEKVIAKSLEAPFLEHGVYCCLDIKFNLTSLIPLIYNFLYKLKYDVTV